MFLSIWCSYIHPIPGLQFKTNTLLQEVFSSLPLFVLLQSLLEGPSIEKDC